VPKPNTTIVITVWRGNYLSNSLLLCMCRLAVVYIVIIIIILDSGIFSCAYETLHKIIDFVIL
jgi:hypothetical protein